LQLFGNNVDSLRHLALVQAEPTCGEGPANSKIRAAGFESRLIARGAFLR
jgi:hypothetical protein